jgi:hypothetical protein
MQSNVVNSLAQTTTHQIPLANSTQILGQTTPLINSVSNPVAMSTSPGTNNPSISVSYAPIVSALKPQPPSGLRPKVTVVPIYD